MESMWGTDYMSLDIMEKYLREKNNIKYMIYA